MARIRKRVYATRRAPDGSAFQKCSKCEILVPIALEDMHDCEVEKDAMKRKIGNESQIESKQGFRHQPKSAFRFFMESFVKSCEGNNNDNQIEDDREGFNKWRKMSERDKVWFVLEAEKVNSAYTKALLREAENMSSWENDDEADSAEVGKYDENYENCKFYEEFSSSFPSFWSNGSESFGNVEWELLRPHVIMKS